jgi:hypothetical protein
MNRDLPTGSTAAERETIFRFDDADKTVIIWTASAPVARRLLRQGLEPTQISRRRDGSVHGLEFRAELGRFRWSFPRRRVLSAAERACLRDRLSASKNAQRVGAFSAPDTPFESRPDRPSDPGAEPDPEDAA